MPSPKVDKRVFPANGCATSFLRTARALALALVVLPVLVHAATQVSFETDPFLVGKDQEVTVGVDVSCPNLVAIDVRITFDNTVVQFVSNSVVWSGRAWATRLPARSAVGRLSRSSARTS